MLAANEEGWVFGHTRYFPGLFVFEGLEYGQVAKALVSWICWKGAPAGGVGLHRAGLQVGDREDHVDVRQPAGAPRYARAALELLYRGAHSARRAPRGGRHFRLEVGMQQLQEKRSGLVVVHVFLPVTPRRFGRRIRHRVQ